MQRIAAVLCIVAFGSLSVFGRTWPVGTDGTEGVDGLVAVLREADTCGDATILAKKSANEFQRLRDAGLARSISRVRSFSRPVGTDKALFSRSRIYRISLTPGTSARDLMAACMRSGYFEQVEPDYRFFALAPAQVFPNDWYFHRQWGFHNDGTFDFPGTPAPTVDADVDLPEAWAVEQGDSSIIVAIIDTGLKLDHYEFRGRLWHNPGEIPENGLDDDNNGYVDDTVGWNFKAGDNDPADDLGHGTAVTSVLAANSNNAWGMSGVDWECKLMILKVMDSYSEGGSATDIADAIIYATDNGARVINMSLGDWFNSLVIRQAVRYARTNNVLVVAASGNDDSSAVTYPARYSEVVAVGSTDPDDRRTTSFFIADSGGGSNYGAELDVMAPGNFIYFLNNLNDTILNVQGGTSLASPLVAGIASLLLAQNPGRSADDIQAILEETADDQVGDPAEDTPGKDVYFGYGRVNAYQAVTRNGQVGTALGNQVRPRNTQITVYARQTALELWYSGNTLEQAMVDVLAVNGRTAVHASAVLRPGMATILAGERPVSGIYLVMVRTQRGVAVQSFVVP